MSDFDEREYNTVVLAALLHDMRKGWSGDILARWMINDIDPALSVS